MSRMLVIPPPYSDKLWDTPWFFECISLGNNKYLVNEDRVNSLFGEYHTFKEEGVLPDNATHLPNQLKIEFDE